MTPEQIEKLVRATAAVKPIDEALSNAETQAAAARAQIDTLVAGVGAMAQEIAARILADQSSDIAKQMQSLADAERTYQAHLAELDAIAQQNDATMVAIETSKAALKSDQATLAGRHPHLMRVAAELNAPVN